MREASRPLVAQRREQREHETAARRIAGEHDGAGLRPVHQQPVVRGEGLIERHREPVLGREPIVERENAIARVAGERRGNGPMRSRRARDVATAVEIQNDVIGRRAIGNDPLARNRAVGALDSNLNVREDEYQMAARKYGVL